LLLASYIHYADLIFILKGVEGEGLIMLFWMSARFITCTVWH